MKNFIDLNLGFNDAKNYRERNNKEMLKKFFYKDDQLTHLLKPSTYFLLGDKGTGKTAYSVFLANNAYHDFFSSIYDIQETEYLKFIKLKQLHKLDLSDYSNIWKVLLLVLMSQQIKKGEDWTSLLKNYRDFDTLNELINQFYDNGFSPEIEKVITIVEDYKKSVSCFGKLGTESNGNGVDFGVSDNESRQVTNVTFQMNLLLLEKRFMDAIDSLRLQKNHIIFIDGIDLRPHNIAYEDYLECVKGLASAVWHLNTTFFANIKDSRGRLRVLLLLRPDIFAQLGLHNANNIVRDNSVLLDWKTYYPQHRQSSIFKLIDRMLSVQQDEKINEGDSWDYYFPYKNRTTSTDREPDSSFVLLLRRTTFRPREIISFMKIAQDYVRKHYPNTNHVLTYQDYQNKELQESYSKYLLGEIQDYLAFYHTQEDYEIFLTFFRFLKGRAEFNYKEYCHAYKQFAALIKSKEQEMPKQFDNCNNFLQFLYDMNVICYIYETEEYTQDFHWSYRDKDYSNVNPKVETIDVKYRVHYGLQRALHLEKKYVSFSNYYEDYE